MKKYIPRLVVLVVYKAKDNNWRGFCNPYDVICEAESKKLAMAKLEKLVKLYEGGLKKYGYPKHLSLRSLSEKDDKKIFNIVIKKIGNEIKQKLTKSFLAFQVEKEKESFSTMKSSSIGYYYQQNFL